MTTVDLPARFHADHTARDLAGGTVVKRTARLVRVELDAASYDELLADARHYAAGADAGFDPAELGGLIASARATVRRLLATPRPEETR